MSWIGKIQKGKILKEKKWCASQDKHKIERKKEKKTETERTVTIINALSQHRLISVQFVCYSY